ncbi:GGDEF domain-containing protein [Rheinheimera sediminis]|nr:GGDEF domain-containing protein [Rheinheimera sp. YQF-1]
MNVLVMFGLKKQRRYAMFLFLLLYGFSLNAQSVVSDLSYLDSIKSTNFEKFESELARLEEIHHKFQKEELDYFLFLKAYSLTFKGQNQEALSLIIPLLESKSETVIGFRAKSLAVNTLLLSRRYLEAFTYLEQLIVTLPLIEQPMAREHGLRVIAMMYNLIGRYDLALSYLDQLINERPSINAVCAAHQLRSEALFHSGQSEDFEQKSAEGLKYCIKHEQLLWVNIIVSFQARNMIAKEDYTQAINVLTAHYSQVEQTRYATLVREFDSLLAQSYHKSGQTATAKQYVVKAENSLHTATSNLTQVEILLLLSQIAKTEKNYQQALDYHEQYTAAFTAYMDDKSAQQMAYHTAHSEILAQNQKIALLDKDNQLLQYEQTALKHQAAFNKLLIIALAILVLGLAFMAYRSFVARQRFKALAEYDDLTAISNRYHFSASAKEALALCEKGQLPAALIVFDLDHFKQINDQHGHAAGDWALRQTVDTCRNFMRNNDVFGRIGGEEFAILLPGCQSDKAHLLADICRDAIHTIDTAASGYEFKLSASFGVTSAEISGYHLTKLIEDADTAMYQAKQQGRNKVQFFRG